MHCDYLNITVPEASSREVHSDLLGVISGVGAVAVFEGLYKILSGGSLKIEPKRGFTLYSASGGFLSALREYGYYSSYLAAFSASPHNVSRLDIAHDVPGESPPLLRRLVRQVKSKSGLKLTRKALNPQTQLKMILSPGPDGVETGSVYLGNRSAEVRAKVYDKQHERRSVARVDIPPTTRYELTVTGKAGASLRDAYEPDAIFWHFMSEVLSAPPDAPLWHSGSLGYDLPSKVALLPSEALRRLLDTSPQLLQMFALADRIGPHGYQYFLRLLNDRYQAHLNQQGASDSARSVAL